MPKPCRAAAGCSRFEHGEHIGIDEPCLAGDRDLRLFRPQFQDALLKILCEPGARRRASPDGLLIVVFPLKSQASIALLISL